MISTLLSTVIQGSTSPVTTPETIPYPPYPEVAQAAGSNALYPYLYLIATVLFITGIKRLSKVRTARSGNQFAAIGMLIAVITALMETGEVSWGFMATGLIIGAVVGGFLARWIQMTQMPEMVAAFNGLGGGGG